MLLLTVVFGFLLADELRDGRVASPTLSPDSIEALDLQGAGDGGLLVDVEGFDLVCDDAVLEADRVLVPVRAGHSMVVFAFDHSGDCRELDSRFRARAKLDQVDLPLHLQVAPGEREVVLVEAHEIDAVLGVTMLVFGGLSLLGGFAAWSRRRELIEERSGPPPWRTPPVEKDRRAAYDPYRPGSDQCLITEPLTPAPAYLDRLRRARHIGVSAGVVLLLLGGAVALFGGGRIYERERTWSQGVAAPLATASGESERHTGVFVVTTLDVSYVDQEGGTHREQLRTRSLFLGIDDGGDVEVHYRAEAPGEIALSWVHEQRRGSIALVSLCAVLVLGIGLMTLRSGLLDPRPVQAAAVFADPREVLLDLQTPDPHRAPPDDGQGETYDFRIRDSDRCWSHRVLSSDSPPLFLDRRKGVAIGLVDPSELGFVVVLDEALSMLDDPPFSAAELRGRYQRTLKDRSSS